MGIFVHMGFLLALFLNLAYLHNEKHEDLYHWKEQKTRIGSDHLKHNYTHGARCQLCKTCCNTANMLKPKINP